MSSDLLACFPDAKLELDVGIKKAFAHEPIEFPDPLGEIVDIDTNMSQPHSVKCTWGNRRLERFLSRYIYTYKQKSSEYRTEMLKQFETVAAENGVALPTADEMSKRKPKQRVIFEAVQATKSDEVKEYKAYYDGENIVAYIPGENKATKRELAERTMWDDIFDAVYMQLQYDPEFSVNGKTKEERAALRVKTEVEIIRQLKEYYLYDDEKEKDSCVMFVERKMYNKFAAYNERKKRFYRKKDQVKWTAWWTITYDDALFSCERSFRKALLTKFRNLAFRKQWRIMGVFEHGEEGNRLHFHGFFYIPEGSEIGELVNASRPSSKGKGWQNYKENTEFRRLFGINKYEAIDYGTNQGLSDYANYTTKMLHYMDKGEKVFYSRHIPSEFLLELKSSEIVVAYSITCKRPIKRYVVWSGAVTKTETTLERKARLYPPKDLFELMSPQA